MSISKLRNSTTNEEFYKAITVDKMPGINRSGQLEKDTQSKAAPASETIAADSVRTFLRKISENSVSEIDDLITDLRGLREKLTTDGTQLEQQIVEYAGLNESVLKLTEVVSGGVAQVKTTQSP